MARIVVAAGASGGHVYPALATAVVLRTRGHEVDFVGGDRLEARVVPEAGFPFHAIPVRRPPSVRLELVTPRGLSALASVALATRRARRLLGELRPDVVLGMGGFAAVPVALAAGRGRPRLVLHEQNANLSLAQRIALRWADVLALGLPLRSPPNARRIELVGHPVREAIVALSRLAGEELEDARAAARHKLGLDPRRPTVGIFGGSLGSGPLNDLVPTMALPAEVQVVHVCGPDRDEPVRVAWGRRGVPAAVFGYLDNIEDAYLAADVAISRSGASTVAEFALAGLPSVLVPLPTLARGDQEANARVFESAGAGIVILQSSPSLGEAVGAEVSRLVADEGERAGMAAASRSLARPEAAVRLADIIESVID